MTQIRQDTQKVHLVGEDGRAICGVEDVGQTVELAAWQAGFTPATIGARVCRGCEEKAGTGARFEHGGERSNWKPLDT